MANDTRTSQDARRELYEIIRRDVPFEEKARAALDLGKRYLAADSGFLARIDEETDHWEALVSTDSAGGRVPPGLENDLGSTYCRRTMAEDTPIALHDVPNQGWGDDPAFEAQGLYCYHGTRLVIDGDPYGTVCFVAEDPRSEAFSDDETMFAELIARLLERELEREGHEAELTRQANLATVLNRVLRHNLRNEMAVIRGYTQLMADDLPEDSYADAVLENVDRMIALSDKSRELDRIVAADADREPTSIGILVESVVESVADAFPGASFSVECEEDITAAVLPSFERAIEELVENAAKHGGENPTVSVAVETVPNAVEVRITDDGPGLDDQEVEVLGSGTETPLTHGSGLGLWLAHWIVDSHDGSIDATVTEDGTEMTITVPRTSSTDVGTNLTKLTRARDRYQAAFEEASDAMVLVDDDARIMDANPAAAGMYGLDKRALLGRALPEFLPDDFDFDGAWREFQDVGPERDTVTVNGADGVERVVEYSATPDIVPGQHLVVSRDVTDRIRREAELARKTHAMDEAPVGITITDPNAEDNPMVYANEQFRDLTGYDEDEILGRNCRFLQGAETGSEKVRRIRRAIDEQEPVTVTLRNYRKDGTGFWNRLTLAPVEDEDGELANWIGFQEDVTDRIERRQSLEEPP